MNLFGSNKKSKEEKFRITEPDREWVEENFRWLIKLFGYPSAQNEQILLTDLYFPKTFKSDKLVIDNIIQDLCALCHIQEGRITYQMVEDIRDTYGVPFQIEGRPFETEIEVKGEIFKIYIAYSLQNHPQRLIYNLVYEFIKINLMHRKVQFDTGEDTDLFIYIAGIYFGFGVLLSQGLTDIGRKSDAFWETRWNYISQMPLEVMAFGLATYSKLIEQNVPSWKENLPPDLKKQFEKAIFFLEENPSQLYDQGELESSGLFKKADELYKNNKFEEGITILQKILLLTKDDFLRADAYNNIGYYLLRLERYEDSIPFFKNSILITPDYGYANDNLGYAFIQIGELEEGKKWLDLAMQTETNDIAYTYRNLAIYHQAKGQLNLAEENFQKAFNTITTTVDLLEYHFADFHFKLGKIEEGLKYLKMAEEKGEPEAIRMMNERRKK